MIGPFLSTSASLSRLAFAILALASAGRFGAAGFRMALAAATPTPAPAQAQQRPRVPRPVRSASPEPAASTSSSRQPAQAGEPVTLTLAITAGPPRSEVYVNGRHVADSPFFGDISCKRGNLLTIEIVPKDGELIEVQRRCRSGMMRVSDAVLNDPYRQE